MLPHDELGHAIARVEISLQRPWLIPELYTKNSADNSLHKWIENAELFVGNYEKELLEVVGVNPTCLQATR